jgi:hypothetical protein
VGNAVIQLRVDSVSAAAFGGTVSVIVGIGAEKKVSWVAASSVVALMQHEAVARRLVVTEQIGQPMGEHLDAVNANGAVPVLLAYGRGPLPAIVGSTSIYM